MPVRLNVIEQKFLSKYNNDNDYTENPTTDFSSSFKGGVLESIRVITTLRIGSYAEMRNWSIKTTDDLGGGIREKTITREDGNFFDDGFFVGAYIRFADTYDRAGSNSYNGSLILKSVTQNQIIGDTVITGFPIDNGYPIPNLHNTEERAGYLVNISPITGLEYKFGLIENNDSTNFLSKLTGQENQFKFTGIDTSVTGTQHTGFWSGINKAGQSGSATVEYLGTVNNTLPSLNTFESDKDYEVVHDFDILPFYLDGEEDAIQGLEEAPDIFSGTKSLKYVFEASFYGDITNSNTVTTQSFSDSIGGVGYYGESFNGFPNKFTVNDLVYYNETLSEEVDQLSIGERIRVNFTVSNEDADFIATNPIMIIHSAIIDGQSYSFSVDNFQTTWTKGELRVKAGDSAASNSMIKDLEATYVDGSNIDVQFYIEFSTDQNNRLTKGQNYILQLVVGKGGEDTNSCEKVSLLVDWNVYEKNTDIDGLSKLIRLENLNHPNDYVSIGDTAGYTNGKFNIEEGVLSICEFAIDSSKDAVLNSLYFNFVVYNTVTESYTTLRRTRVNISDSVTVEGFQKISLSSNRGYNLPTDDQFNSLSLLTLPEQGVLQPYVLAFGYKIPWQEWLAFKEAATIFYNATQPENGLNQFSNNYASNKNTGIPTKEDYSLRVLVQANVAQDSIETTYNMWSEDIEVWGYDEDDQGDPPSFVCSIQTYGKDADGVKYPIEGNIFQDDYTEIRATFAPPTVPTFSVPVDFTNVEATYTKFAHGNPQAGTRNGDWDNGQADDDDTFNDGGLFITKTGVTYTTLPSSITTLQNASAYYGLYSPDEYEFYSLSGSMYSDNADDDGLGYVIAMFEDDLGVEHTISLVATTGGLGFSNGGQNPSFPYPSGSFEPGNGIPWYVLIYNYGKEDVLLLDSVQMTSNESGYNWNNALVGDLDFLVTRNGQDITVEVDWTINSVNYNTPLSYTIGTDSVTNKFVGAKSIGFAFNSQNQGGFKDVTLNLPSTDYYVILRAEPETSPTEFDIAEINSIRDTYVGNLLKEVDGSGGKAQLNYTAAPNPAFIGVAQVDTSKVSEGQTYKLSAQIGTNDLGDIDFLVCYAFVSVEYLSTLYVFFNNNATIVDTTGLTLSGSSETITGINSGDGTDVLVFDLSDDLDPEATISFVYNGSNTITSSFDALDSGSIVIDIS